MCQRRQKHPGAVTHKHKHTHTADCLADPGSDNQTRLLLAWTDSLARWLQHDRTTYCASILNRTSTSHIILGHTHTHEHPTCQDSSYYKHFCNFGKTFRRFHHFPTHFLGNTFSTYTTFHTFPQLQKLGFTLLRPQFQLHIYISSIVLL